MKNILKTKHPLRREAPRLHMYKGLPESPVLYQITSRKEGSTKIVDVQGLKKIGMAAK
nr:hypothetical protein [Tanacetum cinerariifolium]